jgi:hypothetical protein
MDDGKRVLQPLLVARTHNVGSRSKIRSEGMSAALVDALEVTEVPPPFARFVNFERMPTL